MAGPSSSATTRPSLNGRIGDKRLRKSAAMQRGTQVKGQSDTAQGATKEAKHINARICCAADAGDVQALLSIVAAKVAAMNCVNMSTALHKLAWLHKDTSKQARLRADDCRFVALRTQIQSELERQRADMRSSEAKPRCWATIAWAYGSLQLKDAVSHHAVRIISKLSRAHLNIFKPLELTNLLWGFAKLQDNDKLLFDEAKDYIEANISTFECSNLATIMWAFVTVGKASASFLQSLAEEFVARLPHDKHVQPCQISSVLWSMATAKVHVGMGLLHELSARSVRILHTFKLPDLSIAAWAVSRIGVRFDLFFKAVANLLSSNVWLRQQVHPQGAANLFWAFERQVSFGSNAGREMTKAAGALLPACQRLLPQLKLQELICLLQSIAKLGVQREHGSDAGHFFMSAVFAIKQYESRLSERDLVNVLEAYRNVAHEMLGESPAFFEVLPELVHMCISSVQKFDHGTACDDASDEQSDSGEKASPWCAFMEKILDVMLLVPPLAPERREQLLIGVASHALQGNLGHLSPGAQEQLANFCSLGETAVTECCLRTALAQLAGMYRESGLAQETAAISAAHSCDAQFHGGTICPPDAVGGPLGSGLGTDSPHCRIQASQWGQVDASMQGEHVLHELLRHREQESQLVRHSDCKSAPTIWNPIEMSSYTEAIPPCSIHRAPSTLAEEVAWWSMHGMISVHWPYTEKNTFLETEADGEAASESRRRFSTETLPNLDTQDATALDVLPTFQLAQILGQETHQTQGQAQNDGISHHTEMLASIHTAKSNLHTTWLGSHLLEQFHQERDIIPLEDEAEQTDCSATASIAKLSSEAKPWLGEGPSHRKQHAYVVRRSFVELVDEEVVEGKRLTASRFVSTPVHL